MKTYLVQFEKSEQFTEDSWRVCRPSLEVDIDTRMQEILKWAVEKNGGRLPQKIEIMDIEKLK